MQLKFVLFLILFLPLFSSPEDDLIVVEHFLSPETTNAFIQAYNAQQTQVNAHTDNQLSVASLSDPRIRRMFYDVVDRVLQLMYQKYPLNGKRVELDHGALFARIPPNYAAYHNDNCYFECPIHGRDQSILRKVCPQDCPGSKFVPNHTSWREYTALLYLNDDFEGGEIQFEDGPCNKTYKRLIPIKAGMLILSPNGPHFYHEVLPMCKGKRHSMHLWFTTDPRHFHQRYY